jgi:hypothetical protein
MNGHRYIWVLQLLLVYSRSSDAQLYDRVWVTGGIATTFTFDSTTVTADTIAGASCLRNECLRSHRGWSSICDEAGTLQLFTNGHVIISAADMDTMDNGTDISDSVLRRYFSDGIPFSHHSLIFPRGNHKYWVVNVSTTDDQGAPTMVGYGLNVLYYAEVDMSLNGGLGSVTSKHNLLYKRGHISREQLTACKHGNGRDYWMVAVDDSTNTYVKFLVTPDSVLGPYKQSIGAITQPSNVGQSTFSADGSKYASISSDSSELNILDFDRCSGMFFNSIHFLPKWDTIPIDSTGSFHIDAGAFAVAFSPSGRYLYVIYQFNAYQYDLQSGNIEASRTPIFIWDWRVNTIARLHNAYLAPNGEILVENWGSSFNINKGLNIIEHPDLAGSACGFVKESSRRLSWFGLVYTVSDAFLCNTFNYRLGKKAGSGCDTLRTGIEQIGIQRVQVSVYPIPAASSVQVDIAGRELGERLYFVQYDLVGQEVARQEIPHYQIQAYRQGLASGMYTWQVQNDKHQIYDTGKMVWD